MTANFRKLRSDEPNAAALAAALQQGDVGALDRLLAGDPTLATVVVEDAKGGGRTPLHLFADAPGHRPNAAAIVTRLASAGADLNAPPVKMWHQETPLHWAASNDDVALIDALLDAGADIERAGSSIDRGSPLSSAVGYGQWAAARQLLARGAKTQLWHEAALGLVDAIQGRLDADPALRGDALSGPLWNSCHGGQLAAAQLLLKHGADLSWSAPWSGQTSLDIAEAKSHAKVVAWLRKQGAVSGKQEG